MTTRRAKARLVTVAAAGALIAVFVAAAATAPVPVKATTRNEVSPAADAEWFAWSKSRSKDGPFDVWAQRGTEPAFKVNAKGTQAYTGGIDGTRLVYQQLRAGRSDVRMFDLVEKRHRGLPAGVNSKSWECCPSISDEWLLFTRGRIYSGNQIVILRNLGSTEQRTLDRLRNKKGFISSAQISGNYAVWMRCNPHPRCQILRHDILARNTTALAVPQGKVVYSPSVNANGTTYYIRSGRGCGKAVEIVKETVLGVAQTLAALPAGVDVDVTYANARPGRGPVQPFTRVYYDRIVCRRETWDIFSIDDIERPPPPQP
jgi:hypothetical protein